MEAAKCDWRGIDGISFLLGATLLVVAVVLSVVLASDVGDALTRNTIRLSLLWYVTALMAMLQLSNSDWAVATRLGRLARWLWTWGVVAFLIHLAMAFHYFHHWSHTHAFEHTRAVSGRGEGLYVSYTFTLFWIADVAWWWISPRSYAARNRGIHWALQGFLLFIAFNGAVVYESGPIRWAGLIATGGLALAGLVAWQRKSAIRLARS